MQTQSTVAALSAALTATLTVALLAAPSSAHASGVELPGAWVAQQMRDARLVSTETAKRSDRVASAEPSTAQAPAQATAQATPQTPATKR